MEETWVPGSWIEEEHEALIEVLLAFNKSYEEINKVWQGDTNVVPIFTEKPRS